MNLTEDQYNEMIMGLVVDGGNARSFAMEAIHAAKSGQFEEASEKLEQCNQALIQAHHAQTELIQSEISGDHIQVQLLMVHAQDHLMDAFVVRDLAQEIVDLYRALKDK